MYILFWYNAVKSFSQSCSSNKKYWQLSYTYQCQCCKIQSRMTIQIISRKCACDQFFGALKREIILWVLSLKDKLQWHWQCQYCGLTTSGPNLPSVSKTRIVTFETFLTRWKIGCVVVVISSWYYWMKINYAYFSDLNSIDRAIDASKTHTCMLGFHFNTQNAISGCGVVYRNQKSRRN